MKATKLKKAVTWMIQIVLAMIFLTMGMAKLSGVESTIQLFEQIGLGQWFRYITGAIEVTAAVLLLFGPYATLGAGLILMTMTGAVMTHLWWIGGSVLPPFVLGAAAGVLIALRRASRRAEELASLEELPRKKSA
jgi:putative oxidoreductase